MPALRRLASELPALRESRGSTAVVLVLGCVLGLLLGRAIDGGASPASAQRDAEAHVSDFNAVVAQNVHGHRPAVTGTSSSPDAPKLRAALRRGVVDATRAYPGTAEIAAWVSGDATPVWYGDAETPHRMWSMSKVATAIALERETHGHDGVLTREALADALARSDNCAQRTLVGKLQDVTGGPANALDAFGGVLSDSGASPRSRPQEGTIDAAGGDTGCPQYVRSHGGSPDGKALLLGTAEWNLLDAIQFAHALGDGTYGAPGRTVLRLMRQPKLRPQTSDPSFLTVPLDWGAGRAFSGLDPAYKGGWGGYNQKDYLAGQIVVVHIGGKLVALAAIYHPLQQPANDDPGQTHSDRALELMFAPARRALKRLPN
jgi:hypothetical protein